MEGKVIAIPDGKGRSIDVGYSNNWDGLLFNWPNPSRTMTMTVLELKDTLHCLDPLSLLCLLSQALNS